MFEKFMFEKFYIEVFGVYSSPELLPKGTPCLRTSKFFRHFLKTWIFCELGKYEEKTARNVREGKDGVIK